jgi:hypothetical protein
MTISSELNRVSHNCDGSTKTFPIPFAYYNKTHIKALLVTVATGAEQLLAQDSDYGLTEPNASGGTLTTLALDAYASAYRLVIYREVPLRQETDLIDGGALPADPTERTFDMAVMMIQQLAERIERVMALPVGSLLSNIAFPPPGAGCYLRWNAAGTALEAVSFQTTDLVVSAFIQTLLDDADAAVTLVTLGLTALAAELNQVCGGNTATAAQISNKANSEAFVTNANGGPNISATPIEITAVVAQDIWKSIGPTGSGADNIWGALDSVPSGVDWIRVRVSSEANATTSSSGSACYLNLSTRKTGSTQGYGEPGLNIAGLKAIVDSSGKAIAKTTTEMTLPVDSARRFDVHWYKDMFGFQVSYFALTLVGYGYNP